MLVLFQFCLLHTLLDDSEEFSGAVSYHSEELTTAQSVIPDSHTTVPDAHNDHDVGDVHLLEYG